jgi:hypothetical protein
MMTYESLGEMATMRLRELVEMRWEVALKKAKEAKGCRALVDYAIAGARSDMELIYREKPEDRDRAWDAYCQNCLTEPLPWWEEEHPFDLKEWMANQAQKVKGYIQMETRNKTLAQMVMERLEELGIPYNWTPDTH